MNTRVWRERILSLDHQFGTPKFLRSTDSIATFKYLNTILSHIFDIHIELLALYCLEFPPEFPLCPFVDLLHLFNAIVVSWKVVIDSTEYLYSPLYGNLTIILHIGIGM